MSAFGGKADMTITEPSSGNMDIERTEDEEFSFAVAVSDEALEGAGNADRLANFSLGGCTEARVCSAPN